MTTTTTTGTATTITEAEVWQASHSTAKRTTLIRTTAVQEICSELGNKIGGQLSFSTGCDFHLSFENIKDAIARPQPYRSFCLGRRSSPQVQAADIKQNFIEPKPCAVPGWVFDRKYEWEIGLRIALITSAMKSARG